MSTTTLFPSNPSHGMIFELRTGLFFKYDATVNSWIKIASNTLMLAVATPIANGAMSAADLKKLNRLVLPPPLSSIIGTDCVTPFKGGNISLSSGDKFISVDGSVSVQNIGSRGEKLNKKLPFQIHQHTYGFDFTINLPDLVEELKARNQFNVVGKVGEGGATGEDGDPGPNFILSGPAGTVGDDGAAPPCSLTIEADTLQAQPHEGMSKALVAVKVVRDTVDPLKYKLVFDRQTIGPANYAADKLHVRPDKSPWVLAIVADAAQTDVSNESGTVECEQVGSGGPQQVYYLDIEPIIELIRQQYLKEAGILRKGYEDIVRYWVNTMSDLFDEQKAALCCALEFCMSATKSTEIRQHMESTAAQAAGSANILLHGRNSKEAVSLSSTRLLKEIGGPDLCRGGPQFPQYPNLATGGTGGVPGGGAPPPPAPQSAPPPPQTLEAQSVDAGVDRAVVTIDPLLHSSSVTGVQVPLVAGNYSVVIDSTDAQVEGEHRANVKIQHFKKGVRKTAQFLNKGSFESASEAKTAYQGLSLSFKHDGGMASFWLPSLVPQAASGAIRLVVQPAEVVATPAPAPAVPVPAPVIIEAVAIPEPVPEPVIVEAANDSDGSTCEIDLSHLAWYEKSWVEGNCCGLVVNVMGQDYIIVKRSMGSDTSCGGGENANSPCMEKFGHPSFAWPTFDGRRFAPLPKTTKVAFRFDEKLNDLVAEKIANGDFLNGKGSPAGIRHLSYQLVKVLFPAS